MKSKVVHFRIDATTFSTCVYILQQTGEYSSDMGIAQVIKMALLSLIKEKEADFPKVSTETSEQLMKDVDSAHLEMRKQKQEEINMRREELRLELERRKLREFSPLVSSIESIFSSMDRDSVISMVEELVEDVEEIEDIESGNLRPKNGHTLPENQEPFIPYNPPEESPEESPEHEPEPTELNSIPPWEEEGIKQWSELVYQSPKDVLITSAINLLTTSDDEDESLLRAVQCVYSNIPTELWGSEKASKLVQETLPIIKQYLNRLTD